MTSKTARGNNQRGPRAYESLMMTPQEQRSNKGCHSHHRAQDLGKALEYGAWKTECLWYFHMIFAGGKIGPHSHVAISH